MTAPFQNTLKERKRYILYEPAGDEEVQQKHKELFGIHGAAKAGIIPVEQREQKSILRVAHNSVDELKAALVFSNKKSIKTSGTLQGVRKLLKQ
ncbi:MAG: hypothetical protein ACMXYD_02000 [Candidatus Woesearchaeota archaeon]